MPDPIVAIIIGSDSDFETVREALPLLEEFGVGYEVEVASAHRSPERLRTYLSDARRRGIKIIIAGAGMAAHLAGVAAAETTLPVIGVPIDSPPLHGLDALLSTVQMPPGVPVATMAIGRSGARNAALFAARILALSDPVLAEKLVKFKEKQAAEVAARSERLKTKIGG